MYILCDNKGTLVIILKECSFYKSLSHERRCVFILWEKFEKWKES